ncbi:4-(cytidine 5'-diphospho)-2-C-methyl-D-erythritol kinase [Curvibacter sp. PAE-UM]|uniref:4-(cytidine 5'-diphospho)-2-C-methyl-D-erythritol kinase n=1 Tax=Curvibacter sp. PAE-UM TaxID=1714344 RepID=UPI00070F857D|nr:4-(cytidine 5'-diphospho)-2-C-methyl-D-erythritol kinase [Curvibacter sp. PAE-UM]KRH99205.1 4-diphosphocytidyl-2C-methyl-D-erythritol kinase [Curvibacter sp. PAE-UM]
MQSLHDIPAPAKLNLFLHITGRRTDGYHLLQSVFMLIDWADTLHVERRDQGRLSREDLLAPLPADDLILQAARALQAATGTPHGAHIAVEKRLPAQAGLGGGSSDAASTLLALNRLWQLGLSLEQLCVIGLQLGADVPFFLRGHNAWVEGIGESITPVELPRRHVLVVKPQAGLETRAIFSDPALKRDSIPATISGFAADPQAFLMEARNDLQPVAQRLCPGVTQALEWLATLGLAGRMTGSGSAVFAWAPPDLRVPKAPDTLQARLCCSLEAHPLSGWAASEKS